MSQQTSEQEIGFHDPDSPRGEPANSMTTECGAAISNDRMERFLSAFEASARRWEIIVYPALFAFVVLAGYGFYLVYSLTKDVSVLAQSVERSMAANLQVVASNMQDVSHNVARMTAKMDIMTAEMEKMTDSVAVMKPMSEDMKVVAGHMDNMDSMKSIDQNIASMNKNMTVMAGSTDRMSRDVGVMNRSISPPMNFMHNFMPW
ncbi:hypothetical protein [Endothiovibrio diazotrophicus]